MNSFRIKVSIFKANCENTFLSFIQDQILSCKCLLTTWSKMILCVCQPQPGDLAVYDVNKGQRK